MSWGKWNGVAKGEHGYGVCRTVAGIYGWSVGVIIFFLEWSWPPYVLTKFRQSWCTTTTKRLELTMASTNSLQRRTAGGGTFAIKFNDFGYQSIY